MGNSEGYNGGASESKNQICHRFGKSIIHTIMAIYGSLFFMPNHMHLLASLLQRSCFKFWGLRELLHCPFPARHYYSGKNQMSLQAL
ncbi:hypothetical protein QN277_026430 [Acacia crassicarpa]|uniref:Uncharacterized protein n=1 Tax=Acacia crassicarpa TaxID=499986 RepID=A0AAE1K6L8_9FABA|nr:hypothetical protein QN277_026430 [Acacia crassicarpa]